MAQGFDWSKIGNWFTNGDNLNAFGSLASAAGNIYGGIQQNKAYNQMIDLDNRRQLFNEQQILKDEEDLQKKQAALDAAFNSSGLIKL